MDYTEHCEPQSQSPMENHDYPLEIDPAHAKKLMDNDPNVVLLDVRELIELQICRIENSIHIPMGEIPHNIDQLPKEKHILAMCHHGLRSMNVTRFLRAQGFKAVSNIKGGVDAWAKQVDPTLQKY
jgi:rhodanese-related sulfurtransferase